MPITDTDKRGKAKAAKYLRLAALSLTLLIFFPGCLKKDELGQARSAARKAQACYQSAVASYKEIIAGAKDAPALRFELGLLYFNHGEFAKAVEELSRSSDPRAAKYLAMAYYRLSSFTDALEIFNKYPAPDDEYLYYWALTCERLNLFDQALTLYAKISQGSGFAALAKERVEAISRQGTLGIDDLGASLAKILSAAPEAAAYPQASALILKAEERIVISAENTQTDYLHYIVKILNERGKENFGEASIEYDSTDEKVELEYARTIKPDGTVVEVGTRHLRDVSKYLNFPLYSNLRVLIISFPEVCEGASIEYKLKLKHTQLVNKKDFILGYPVQGSEPVIAADFSIEAPREKKFNLKLLNERFNSFGAKLNAEVEDSPDRRIYRWHFKQIPQIIPEANMPPGVELNPAILISTFSSWQEVYEWWWGLARDKLSTDAAIKEKVKELTAGKRSAAEKIGAIYDFCARSIRYVAIEYGQAGYEPHSAADIFKNKYGDCKDQSVLLVAMLRQAGFSAWPVLLGTNDYYNLNPDFPAPFFNHCIAAVLLKERVVFLDPTAETCLFGDLPAGDEGRKALLFKDDAFEIKDTPLFSASHNSFRQKLKITIDSQEKLFAEKDIYTSGAYDQAQRYWLLYTPPQLVEETLKEKIQEVSIGGSLLGYKVENLKDSVKGVLLSYSFRGPEYFTEAGDLRIMPQLAFINTSLVAKEQRSYNLYFGALETQETEIEYLLPPNLKLKYLPATISEETPWLKFKVDYQKIDNKIVFSQLFQLKCKEIPVAEYPSFKEFFAGLAKKIKQRIVLERSR